MQVLASLINHVILSRLITSVLYTRISCAELLSNDWAPSVGNNCDEEKNPCNNIVAKSTLLRFQWGWIG